MAPAFLAPATMVWGCFSTVWFAWAAAGKPHEPPSLIVGNTRVQALSPLLLRVEPRGKYGWEDRNTFMVQNRSWRGLKMRKEAGNNGDTNIKTDHYTVLLAQNGVFMVFDKSGTELYNSGTDKNPNKHLLHWPSPGTASGYGIVDSPRFHVPDWAAAPCPSDVTLPDYERSSNGYDFGNDVDGDTYVFLLGKGIDGWNAARAEFARLTGPVPVLPDWAFGTWYTVWMAFWESWAKSEVTKWRTHKVPLDVWGLDVNWRISKPAWMDQSYDHPNTTAFPDYHEWFAWLREQGVHTYFNDHPWQHGPQTSPAEINFRWNGLTKWLNEGLSFWWFDHNWKFSIGPPNAPPAGNHPTFWKGLSTTAWGSHVYWTVTDNFNRHSRPKDLFAGGRAVALSMSNPHNEISGFTYTPPLLQPDSWAQPVNSAMVAENPGHHRYPVWWNGDFATMNNNCEMMVDAGVHDFKPYVHSDCGGDLWWNWAWKDKLPISLIRQAAMCSFGTILRFHGGEHQPWKYGAQVENIVSKYITFRYKFMPMLIAAGYRAHRDGFPFVARVDLYWPDYGKSSMNHQYIFLDDILVAPLFGMENMSKADVWIPPGRWQNVWNGEVVTGPKDIVDWQPMERQPMWVRMDGGLLAMTDKPGLRVAQGDWSELTLEAYPCIGVCNTSRTIYERDLELNAAPSTTTVSLLSDGMGVVGVQIGENTARLERAWTVRVNMNPGEIVVAATVDGDPVSVHTIEARPFDDGTPYHAFWPFGGKDANPASKAGPVAQVSLGKSARAHTLLLTVTKPIINCSWSGEDCLASTCCKVLGDKCYAKDGSKAVCAPGCKAGESWTCSVLGSRPQVFSTNPATSTGNTTNISLFCFTVQVPAVPWHRGLLESQKAKGYGIYACDSSKVYNLDTRASGKTFIDVWREIHAGGEYKTHDWVVKVDMGAVFLPALLVQHLLQLKPQRKTALYIENSRLHAIAKSLMVFSSEAVRVYSKDQNHKACEKHLGNQSEALFFAGCFDAIGVGRLVDYDLVKVPNLGQPEDATCSQSEFAVASDRRDPDSWERCYMAATGQSKEPVVLLRNVGVSAPLRGVTQELPALGVAALIITLVLRTMCCTSSQRTFEQAFPLVAPEYSPAEALYDPDKFHPSG